MADIWFSDYVLEQLEPFGGVTARRMFGGHGLFKGGLMFGLIADGELFFKVDDSNQPDFEAIKSQPFTFEKRGGKTARMSYWYVPEEIIENPGELKKWAAKAYGVAVKARKASQAKPKPRRTPPAKKRVRRR
ncbi:MAG: TfoX/Sxy family protein [Rhodospirillaceae bacterium]